MSNYLITLTPTGRFFFGGDMTFKVGTNDKDKFNEQFSSYIIKSAMFPQQTSLLGMLRFLILSNDTTAFDKSQQKIINEKRAETLIGEKGFSLSNKTNNDFGYIESISSCFLQMSEDKNQWINLFPTAPLFEKSVDFSSEIEGEINGKKVLIPAINNYDPKCFYEAENTDGVNTFKSSDIFSPDQRIGINRDIDTGKTEENALFKQISYRLGKRKDTKRYRFAFQATVNQECKLQKYNGQLVSLGGDSSQFVLNVFEQDPIEYKTNVMSTTGYHKIVLLSPAYIKENSADFAICNTQPFRFLITHIGIKNYNVLSDEINRSKNKILLYTAGSVFYFKQENKHKFEAFKEAIEEEKEFRQIGYNNYQTV